MSKNKKHPKKGADNIEYRNQVKKLPRPDKKTKKKHQNGK